MSGGNFPDLQNARHSAAFLSLRDLANFLAALKVTDIVLISELWFQFLSQSPQSSPAFILVVCSDLPGCLR